MTCVWWTSNMHVLHVYILKPARAIYIPYTHTLPANVHSHLKHCKLPEEDLLY
jgi:hypothetical protein